MLAVLSTSDKEKAEYIKLLTQKFDNEVKKHINDSRKQFSQELDQHERQLEGLVRTHCATVTHRLHATLACGRTSSRDWGCRCGTRRRGCRSPVCA